MRYRALGGTGIEVSTMSSFRVATDRVTVAGRATHEAPVPLREVFEVSTHRLRSLVGSLSCRTRPASRLVEWVAMLIVTARVTVAASSRRTNARSSPWCTCASTTPSPDAAGFGISVGTAHAYTTAVIDLLAGMAPGLLKVLRESDPDFVLLDGTLAECDRVGDGRADYSAKHRRHGVNVQVVTDPPARCCGCHRLCRAAATTDRSPHPPHHPDLRTQGIPIVADLAYQGAGPWVTTAIKRRPHRDLTATQKTVNRALAAHTGPS